MKAPGIDYFKINSIKKVKKKYYQFKTIETENIYELNLCGYYQSNTKIRKMNYDKETYRL